MRWDDLFADLEAQFEAQQRLERDAEVADRTRRDRATVDVMSRVAAHGPVSLGIRLVDGRSLTVSVLDLGRDWLLLRVRGQGQVLVPSVAVAQYVGLTEHQQQSRTARRFTLGYALRGISRDRSTVRVRDISGAETTGTIDVVGSDSFDLSVHALDEARRTANVRARLTVPFAALVSVAGPSRD